jgi:diguanylate cyclase (GGDEF)-like protein
VSREGDQEGVLPETNGITSRLVLLYARRVGGPLAVYKILREAGLEDREDELMDENYWFSFDEKIRLFEAAAKVLDDPDVMYHVGEVALELNVGEGLKMALRALGSPRLVYQNIVRANAKFSGAHKMEMLDVDSGHATLRYSDITDQQRYEPLDCQYNRGLLACIPQLFGLPRAEIEHPICGCEGGDACVYVIHWEQRLNVVRAAAIGAVASAAAITAAAITATSLLPLAFALPVAITVWLMLSMARTSSRKIERLEREVEDQARVFERLGDSLQDLVSELRLEEVLEKVAANAQVALPGKEFVLLLAEADGAFRTQEPAGLQAVARARLEQWAGEFPGERSDPVTVDDLRTVGTLAPLAGERGGHHLALCAVPLVFREKRLGILVALSPSAHSFLPSDIDVIRSYAAQAAIAIANARLYEAAEELASRDHLTGLLNHRQFHEAMERELARAERYGDRFSVVLFDLDGFKQINDARGHAHGDRVLSQVGGALAGACRASDLAFRVGGDELALLLPATDADEARAAASRAARAMTAVTEVTGVSYGITVWPADAESKDELLRRADDRLYEMKRENAGV